MVVVVVVMMMMMMMMMKGNVPDFTSLRFLTKQRNLV
jgi:hypothetical protein